MDIHRCRFVNYPPSPINAIAFSHTSGTAGRSQPLRLAIGRANGDIEIWDPRQGLWIHETTCKGGRDRSVEGLAWIHDPDEENADGFVTRGRLRLFSIGYSSTVTEWNLNTGLPLRQSTGSHGEVWCVAAQPSVESMAKGKKQSQNGTSEESTQRQDLIAGCEDGTLVLLSTANEDLNFSRFISRPTKKNARALSLAFQDRNTIVAGFADSSIRVFDIRNGTLLRTMSLGTGPRGGPKETLVWALQCLNDGTVVSGDSTGEVCFWDGKTYGQIQRIKGHEADTLCLAASQDSKTVFSGGIDRRTVVYSPTQTNGKKKRWVKTAHRRFHQHDVKAMASFEDKKLSVVVSGGVDTHPMITPMRNFAQEHHRKLSYTPQMPPVTSSGRYLVSWWNREISVWRIARRKRTVDNRGDFEQEPNYKIMARLSLKGDENIQSVSIASAGDLLAVSTAAEIKLFRLQETEKDGKRTIKVEKMDVPAVFSNSGTRLVKFSPDSKWLLCVGLDSSTRLARIVQLDGDRSISILSTPSELKRIYRPKGTQNWLNGDWGSYDRTITRASFSADSRIIAVSDLAGYIDTWVLKGNEDSSAAAEAVDSQSPSSGSDPDSSSDSDSDSGNKKRKRPVIVYGQHWARNPSAHMLPRLPSHALILSFRPSASASPATALPNGNPGVHATRHHPHAHSHALPTTTDDRLLVLTTKHDLQEFSVLSGRLTDWSRRNPSVALPAKFTIQRDRAAGCAWDVSRGRERIWLHGAGWLCMFDLAQDFPQQQEQPESKKRKRDDGEEAARAQRQTKKGTSGAGSKKREDEEDASMGGGKVRKLDADGAVVEAATAAATAASRVAERERDKGGEDESSSDSEADAAMNKLAAYRREGPEEESSEEEDDGEKGEESSADEKAADLKVVEKKAKAKSPHFHITTLYRPILGVVPLSSEEDSDEDERGQPEFAIVERPFWDLDLPPRFMSEKSFKTEDGER